MSYVYPTTVLKLTTPVSMASGAWTAVPWDTCVDDTAAAFNPASPTTITIPDGVLAIRISWYGSWAIRLIGPGGRSMSIEKNSNGSEGGGRGIADTTTAAAVNESGQSLAIPWLPVMVGDVFEFYVLQTSSVSLNYGSGESGFAGVPTVMIEYLTNGKPITIPQLDQKSGTTFSGASSFTLSTTTKVPKEVIIVAVALDTADTVTSISDTDSLTWALRGRKSFGTRDVEYWWAYAPSVISSATTITIHLSNSTHGAGAVATFFGCNTSGATPFDAGNAITLPLEVSGTSATMEASATSVATQHEQAIGIVLAAWSANSLFNWAAPIANIQSEHIAGGSTNGVGLDLGMWARTNSILVQGPSNGNSGTIIDALVQSGGTIAIDGSNHSDSGGNSYSGSTTLTTSVANDLLICCVSVEGSSSEPATPPNLKVTDSNNLTWTRRARVVAGDPKSQIEMWYARASGTYSGTITATWGNSGQGTDKEDDWTVIAYGVANTSGFDTNKNLPACQSNTNGSFPPTVPLETTAAAGMAIFYDGAQTNVADSAPTDSAGNTWTKITSVHDGGVGSRSTQGYAAFWIFSSAVGADIQPSLGSTSGDFAVITDALIGLDSSTTSGVTGTWASTEATDVFSGKSAPLGTWASTEATDVFSGKSAPLGTWASTEAADTFAGAGYPKLTATWASTDNKDVMDFVGHSIPAFGLDSYAVGGGADTSGSGTTSGNVTIETSYPDDVIVLCIATGGFWHHSTVSSITDNIGLHWEKRFSEVIPSESRMDMEVWWAHAPAADTYNIVVNTAGKTGGISVNAFAVASANYLDPWDLHSPLGVFFDNGGSGPALVDITTNSNDGNFIFGFYASNGTPTGGHVEPSDLLTSYLEGVTKNEKDGWAIEAETGIAQTTSATTAGVVEFTSTGGGANNRWIYADAMVGWPSGAWASTEAKDVFASRGDLRGGPWHSTEAKDAFAGAGYPQLTATMPAVEHTDIMAATGDVPPFGPWHSTEAKDAFAGTGRAVPPLSLDATAHATNNDSGGGPVTTCEVTLSTNNAADIIVLMIETGGFSLTPSVVSISDTAGLFWQKRNQRYALGFGSSNPSQEIWWAHAPDILSADAITVTTTSAGVIDVIAAAVAGCNVVAPWDTHSMAGWYMNTNSGNPPCPVHTNADNAFLIAFYGSQGTPDNGTVTAPYTYETGPISAAQHDGFTYYASFAYTITNLPQSGADVSFGQTGGTYNYRDIMVDALVAATDSGTADPQLFYFDGGANTVLSLSGANGSAFIDGFTTFNHNLMYVCVVFIESATGLGEVTGVSATVGQLLNSPGFSRRSRVTDNTGTQALEVWWAFSTEPANNDTITVSTTETQAGDTVSFLIFGVGGATGQYDHVFWDGDPSLPAYNHSNADAEVSISNINTLNLNTLTLAMTANGTTSEASGTVAPFLTDNTNGLLLNTSSAGPPANIAIEFLFSAGLVDNEVAQFGASPHPATWVALADAIPVGLPVPPHGVLAAVETQDTTDHVGNFTSIGIASPGGWVGFPPNYTTSAAIHEAADTCTNDGLFTALPGWGTGWAAFVPAHCTWASTDAKDHASGNGWLIPPQQTTGQWASRELRDRWASSNIAAVTAVWQSTEPPSRWASAGFPIPTQKPVPAPRKRRLLIIT